MNLPTLAVRRPITTAMILVSVLLVGAIAFYRLPLAFLPTVDAPFMFVEIPYPNSHPVQIEKEITKPVEEILSTLSGVKKLNSTTSADGARFFMEFTWGEEGESGDRRLANYWHGDFPWRPDRGYGHTTAVGSYPPNDYGLSDMAGNVWEWTGDWYAERHPGGGGCCVPRNPRGGDQERSFDPRQPQFRVPRKVIKGGSFLCADSYCRRYRPAARRPQMVDTGMSHIGFRCIKLT